MTEADRDKNETDRAWNIGYGGSHAHFGFGNSGGRGDPCSRAFGGPDLRSKLPDLPADLWEGRQLHCVRLYIDGPMQIFSVGPRSTMHHQPILCTWIPAKAPRLPAKVMPCIMLINRGAADMSA